MGFSAASPNSYVFSCEIGQWRSYSWQYPNKSAKKLNKTTRTPDVRYAFWCGPFLHNLTRSFQMWMSSRLTVKPKKSVPVSMKEHLLIPTNTSFSCSLLISISKSWSNICSFQRILLFPAFFSLLSPNACNDLPRFQWRPINRPNRLRWIHPWNHGEACLLTSEIWPVH